MNQVREVKPDVLLGLSAVGGLFSKEVYNGLRNLDNYLISKVAVLLLIQLYKEASREDLFVYSTQQELGIITYRVWFIFCNCVLNTNPGCVLAQNFCSYICFYLSCDNVTLHTSRY